MEPRGYVICTEPRSGSNFLGRVLASTGQLGRPLEWFDQNAVTRSGVKDYPADPEAMLGLIPTLAATDNGVYGLKIFPYQFDFAARTNWPTRLPNLKFVHLERRDLLGQAISLARADQTQQWTSADGAQRAPAYDAKAITDALAEITAGQMRWRRFFGRTGIQPLHLVYEHVVATPHYAAATLAAFMDLGAVVRVNLGLIDLAVQRDAHNDRWRARYVAEHGDPNRF